MKRPWNRGGLRTYLLLLALAFARPGSGALWYGSALLLLGVALQVYSKGCLRQNQVVAMGGPYRFVRHPFYAANLMIDEGIALMSGCLPLAMLLPVWWLLVYLPVVSPVDDRRRSLQRSSPSTEPLPAPKAGIVGVPLVGSRLGPLIAWPLLSCAAASPGSPPCETES